MGYFSPKPAEGFRFNSILYTKKDWVATITLNRPQVFNAINTEVLDEMAQALLDVSWDDSIAVLVLTAVGEKAFCTGGDVSEYATTILPRPRNYWKWFAYFDRVMTLLLDLGKPAIARINGMVVGGGNELHLACDLSIAAEHAKIRQIGPSVGSVPAGGATQWLPILIGDRRAREMCFVNEWVEARQALEWGLVNQVVPYKDLDGAVAALCEKLINKFPECARYTKEQVNFWKKLSWAATIGHARDWLTLHYSSIEPYEGMKAFVEKRPVDVIGLRKRAAAGGSSEFLWGPYTQTCSSCNAKGIPDDFRFCGSCGASLK